MYYLICRPQLEKAGNESGHLRQVSVGTAVHIHTHATGTPTEGLQQ